MTEEATPQAAPAGQETATTLSAFSDQLANAVERASHSIVTVAARPRQSASGVLWQAGSEVVIVTADHVVEREDDIAITLPDGRQTKATLIGRDPSTDLAVLRLAGDLGVGAAPITVSDALRVGHLALAIGRPTEGGPRVSFGVVSSIEGPRRSWQGAQIEGIIFADVTLYPGFSGGPLVDLEGRFVGLNSSRLTRQSAALPVATIRRVVSTLQTHGRVRRGYLGVATQQVPLSAALAQAAGVTQDSALLVVTVEGDSPAEKGGLLMGDIIVSVSGQPATSVDALRAALAAIAPGQPLMVRALRGGQRTETTLVVGERD
ncbi:MAG TPA: trypsin-like peptidase domain-containing protein [Ktedonobacterales bacterium]|nr:trypsin-like peptidase domain-containing protein [Ktedonobacterales bacterium]